MPPPWFWTTIILISALVYRNFTRMAAPTIPRTQAEWRAALKSLPETPTNIPVFFFAHGSPALAANIFGTSGPRAAIGKHQGPDGPLGKFLKDFGPALLEKYKPKGILVFSAHWETGRERLVTDYGDVNPLLMDYYGFPPDLYQLKFNSKGDTAISKRVVQVFKDAGMKARTSPATESRGEDGRGHSGPGLDHGVFLPFRIMFGEEYRDVPIIEATIDSDMTPESNWAIGKAVTKLRQEGILVLSGGLPIHNLRDFSSFSPDTASDLHKAFDQAILDAVIITDATKRKEAMFDLTKHPGFRPSNPREDHFVPLYVAGGAGEQGEVKVLAGIYGCPTIAFGL